MARSTDEPKPIGIPDNNTADPSANGVVPAVENAVGFPMKTWSPMVRTNEVDDLANVIVELPTTNTPGVPRLIKVPAWSNAGPPAAIAVPAMADRSLSAVIA